jgi:hypothetical protein
MSNAQVGDTDNTRAADSQPYKGRVGLCDDSDAEHHTTVVEP